MRWITIINKKRKVRKLDPNEKRILLEHIEVNQESVNRFIIRNQIEILQDLMLKSRCFYCKIIWASTLRGIHKE